MKERLRALLGLLTAKRTVIAPVLAGLATLAAVWAVVPQTSGTAIVVAAERIEAGTALKTSMLETRTYPPALVPEGAYRSPAELEGHTVGAAVARGTPLTAESVLGGHTAAPKGTVLVPLAVAQPAAASTIRTGSRVRVYSSADAPAQPRSPAQGGALISSAVVTGVSRTAEGLGGLGDGGLVLTLAVRPEDAAVLGRVAPDTLSFAILGPEGT